MTDPLKSDDSHNHKVQAISPGGPVQSLVAENGQTKVILGPLMNQDGSSTLDPVSSAAHALEHAGMSGCVAFVPTGGDDTSALMAADAKARQIGGWVQIAEGICWVSQIVVQSDSDIRGSGPRTIIKSLPGSNKDLIYGINSAALWGTASPSGSFAARVTLRDLTLDGNRSNNTAGSCLAIWGPRLKIQNVNIQNAAEHGMRTEYVDEAIGNSTGSMEGTFENIVIDTTGKHGWWHNGPHDSNVNGLIVVDASQSGANQYDAIYADLSSTSRWSHIHTWARRSSAHPRAGINLIGGGQEFSNAHFEGGVTASAWIQSSKNSFDASCSVFAPWSGKSLLLTGTCPSNTYLGKITFHPSGRPNGVPDSVGITLGTSGSDYIHNNIIRAYVEGQLLGAIDFTYSGGENTIEITSYQTSGPGYIGTPAATDYVDLKQSGGAIGVARYMFGALPTSIKPIVSIGTAANNGWYRLGKLSGSQSQTVELKIIGTGGFTASGHSHGETVALLRLENDGAWRGTFIGLANPSTTPVTAMVADSSGYVYAQIGQYAQIDVVVSGSGRFVQDGTYQGTSTPAGTALETTYAFKVGGANALVFQSDGTPQIYTPLQQKSYTVAQLNALTNKAFGMTAFAGNGRKSGETAGNGTGCPVYYGGSNWLTFYDNSVVAA